MRNSLLMMGIVMALAAPRISSAGSKNVNTGQTVDSGSFHVYVNGRRIATETFRILQGAQTSTATSELKVDDGANQASQTSELQFYANGDLRRYQWRELSPGKDRTVVEPSEQFLIEHLVPTLPQKPQDVPFMLPVSTAILDDYFFAHRELLAWRFLAQNCRSSSGQVECKLGKSEFGTLIPRQHTSMVVSVEFTGKEKIKLRGAERELNRVNLRGEGVDWALWLDDQYKLVRILIAAENTEVLRE